MNNIEIGMQKRSIDVGEVSDRAFPAKDTNGPIAKTEQIIFSARDSEVRKEFVGNMNA